MRTGFAALFYLAIAGAQLEDIPIGFIDFFGLNGLDANQLRSALTVHSGDKLKWPQTREQIKADLTKAVGRPFTEFSVVCCDKQRRLMLYIGLAQRSAPTARPRPEGDVTLPPELVTLYDEFMAALPEALKHAAGLPEDYSKGYALSSYLPMRGIQLQMREAAVANEELLLRVLAEAADDKQRIAASHLTGYTHYSPRQVAALVQAASDPNDTVRNNATRPLGVLAATPEFARDIPAEPFIDKLNSAVWSDRNKGLMLLTSLTQSRDPKVLAALKAHALPALIEMAQWQNPGHSGGAIRLLGRIAGMDEKALDTLANEGNAKPVIAAIRNSEKQP